MTTPVKLHTAQIGFDLPPSSSKSSKSVVTKKHRPKSAAGSRKKSANKSPSRGYRYAQVEDSPEKSRSRPRQDNHNIRKQLDEINHSTTSTKQAWMESNEDDIQYRYTDESYPESSDWSFVEKEDDLEELDDSVSSTSSSRYGHRRAWGDDEDDTRSLASSRDSSISSYSGTNSSFVSSSTRPSTAGSASSSFRSQSIQEQRSRFRDYALNSARKQSKKALSNKQKWQKEMKEIKHSIEKTQRELRTLTTHSRNKDVKQEFVTLDQLVKSQRADRVKEEKELNQDLASLRETIRDVAHSVQNAQTNEAFVEKLQTLLESAEDQILQFKNQQRSQYESLSAQQKILEREVAAYQARFASEDWDDLVVHELKPKLAKDLDALIGPSRFAGDSSVDEANGSSSSNNGKSSSSSRRPSSSRGRSRVMNEIQDSSLPDEISVFDRFVQDNGGHLGGWDEKEHAQFVRLYKKYHYLVEKGRDEDFYEQISSMYPYQDQESIIDHCEWWETYSILNDKKKLAIEKWRRAKQEAKESNLEELQDHKEEDEKAKRKKKLREKKERKEKQERLKRWKEEKARKELEELEKAAEEERRKTEAKKKRMQRQRERSQLIKAQSRNRKADEDRLREIQQQIAESEKRHQNSLTEEQRVEERQRMQERDRRMVAKRLEMIEKKQKEKDEVRLRQEALAESVKVNYNVKDDPERLTRNTEALKHKFSVTKDNVGRSHGPASLGKVKHRATPSWRKGL